MLCLCPICSHSRREEIEHHLGRRAPLPQIAVQFDLTRAQLVRHHSVCCAPGPPVVKPVEDLPPGPDRVEHILRRAHAGITYALRAAYAAEDRKGVLQAAALDARHAVMEADIIPTLQEARRTEPVSGLSPEEWIILRNTLISALRAFPEAHATVTQAIQDTLEAQRIEAEARKLQPREPVQ